MSEIQVLIGLIGSGKSTYSQKMAAKGAIIICDDLIVNAVHANNYLLYDKGLKVLYKSIENHIASIAATFNRTIVVDSGRNISTQARQRWLAIARSIDVPCIAIVFPKEDVETHAHRRWQSDDRGYDYSYWLRVVREHNSNYSEPTLEEGFSKITHIKWGDIDGIT